MFGPSSAVAGGGALQPLGGGVLNGASGPLGVAQPAPSFLTTADGHPVKHFTQWNELAPAAQQNLEALEKKIVAAREESTLLEDVARLRGESRGRAEVPSGGEALRRELERRARVASDALRLVETQLWSDNERLAATRDAVTRTLRDVEHAQARLRRLGDARDADALAASHAQLRPGQPPPRDAAPVYVPPPRRPSPFLADATEDLYATAEAFERGTLEMEHNLRATGRVLGHGECGPGLEALAAALDGADKDALGYLSLANLGGGASVADAASGETRYGFTRRALRALGPNASDAEVRDAVEGARRYFDELRRDVAALRERTRRARAEHLAKLRREGDRRDPFAEAEREEEERNRLAALAERPEYAKVGGAAPGVAGTAGAPGAAAAGGALALPAPSPAAPGTAAPFGAPAATPAATPAAGGGLFGSAAPATGGGGLFGGAPAAASTPAAGGGLFGSAAPATTGGGLFGGAPAAASTPAPGGGLFGGASTPAPGGGLFGGASTPAPAAGGGLFGGASTPAPGGGLFGGASASAPTPAGSPAPATPSLFGGAAAPGGGLFGGAASPAPGGFGSPAPAPGGGLFGAPTTQQPRSRSRRR